jgi:crotonobetainyl-CoA:carnitine CoA-transferase CaiB-like acyl-CoA transferase
MPRPAISASDPVTVVIEPIYPKETFRMAGALSHIQVLDLTRVLAGPWACQTLADLGADVIKIERPGCGDDTRAWGPPYLKDQDGNDTREAAYFLSTNRGKKSVTLDISTPEGQVLIRKLAATSDVFIENYKVGDMARYGLSYEDLKELNPRLIYCSITGFGQDGPSSSLAGYDFIIQGMGGLMSITGERDDLPGGGPQKVGVAFSDLMTGLYSTVAILAALQHRNLSGEGQYIDMALLDVQVATMANMNMNYLVSGVIPKRQGNAHANIVPYQVFRSKDGHLVLAVGNDRQFAKFCDVAGCPELAADENFATNAARVRNRETLVPMLQEVLLRRTTQEWITPLESAGVPSGPINDIAQAFEHPQVKHRAMKVTLPHWQAGSVPSVANPIKMSATPITYRSAPPTLGQHTQEILSTLGGLSDAEIAALAAKGVI